MAFNAFLVTVAEVGDFAPHLEVVFGINQVEARGGRAGQHVLTDTHQCGFFKPLGAVFPKARHVQLHNGAWAPVGGFKTLVAARANVAVQPRLAVAQNGTGSIAGAGVDRVVEPLAVFGCDQELYVDAFECLRVGVVNNGAHQPLPLPV